MLLSRAYYFVVSHLINWFVAPFWKCLHIFSLPILSCLLPQCALFVLFCQICLSSQFVFCLVWPSFVGLHTWNFLTKIILRYDQNLKCTIFVIEATNLLLSTCRKKKKWVMTPWRQQMCIFKKFVYHLMTRLHCIVNFLFSKSKVF